MKTVKRIKKVTFFVILFSIFIQLFLQVVSLAEDFKLEENSGIELKSYLNGYEDSTVRPNSNIKREEVATIFRRVFDLKKSKAMKDFIDLDEKRWSYKDIVLNIEAEILEGYPDSTIRPDAEITRAEAVSMLMRYEKKLVAEEVLNKEYKDHWASKEIQSAVEHGYLKGYEDGNIKPNDKMTRAEFATIINRITGRTYDIAKLEKIKEFDDLKKNTWHYEDMVRATNDYIKNEYGDSEELKESKEPEEIIVIDGGENKNNEDNEVGNKLANIEEAKKQIERFNNLTKDKYEELEYLDLKKIVDGLKEIIKDKPLIDKQLEIDRLTKQVIENMNNLILKDLKEVLSLLEEIKIDKLKEEEKDLIKEFEENYSPKEGFKELLNNQYLKEEEANEIVKKLMS